MKTQEDRLNYLIEKFKEESLEYKNLKTPADVVKVFNECKTAQRNFR